MFCRADKRMQYTINGLSLDGDALPRRAVSVAGCIHRHYVYGGVVRCHDIKGNGVSVVKFSKVSYRAPTGFF